MLSPEERQRFVRHRLLPEVGDEGQARLCASHLHIESDDDEAAGWAVLYLRRSGMRLDGEGTPTRLPASADILDMAGDIPGLEAAARALIGALVASHAACSALDLHPPDTALPLPPLGPNPPSEETC